MRLNSVLTILFRAALVLALLPPILCALGFLLSSVFECSGTFHLERCRPPGAYQYVAPLLIMGWVSFFTVPIGSALAVLIAVARWWTARKASR